MAESYHRWRLPALWEMVAADDATNAHVHLATLRRQQTALETQRDRLRTLRDQLAEAWPPEKSEAASAFSQRINDMIRAMSLTASGAADVRTNLSLIVEAIDQARSDMAPLVEEYQRSGDVPDQRIGRHARKLLDERARHILMVSDAAVSEPAAGLSVLLPKYQRISLQSEYPAASVTTDGSTSGGSAGAGDMNRSVASGLPFPRFDPPGFSADLAQDDTVQLAGRSLDETGRDPRPSPSEASRYASSDPFLGPGRVLGSTSLPGPGVISRIGIGTGGGAQMRGVIGGGSGGVPAGLRPGGTSVARGTTAHPIGRTGGHRDASFEEYANRRRPGRGDQDESWSVPRGVAPVIEPPCVRPHDPGPGVLGIDR